ncbi:MAG: endolytic transglycosylase MltG, partial [bacterium]|nr:endolytic transglycosylase MltG [bacterium]
ETLDGDSAEDILKNILANFEKKLTPELKEAIALQKKSVFEIITMASIIEKEVKTMDDKKIVSGILWKRRDSGMPLQVDATVNYITGKNHKSALIEDTKIDSFYNTYKYKGLPLGPISNPGIDSILSAVYPTESKYWYYLSAVSGETIFSETFREHNIAKAKYLK